LSPAHPAKTLISASLAIVLKSMATTLNTPSFPLSKILILTMFQRPYLALDATLATMLFVMAVTSTSTVFATSASIAQIGIIAPLVSSTLASSTLAIDLFLFMSLLAILLASLVHTTVNHVTTAFTVMAHFATQATELRRTSEVTVTNVLSAMIPISVPTARQAHPTYTTRHIL